VCLGGGMVPAQLEVDLDVNEQIELRLLGEPRDER
jgi:hypothetical protein